VTDTPLPGEEPEGDDPEYAEPEQDEPEVVEPTQLRGTVAIVGFPNVGKSTLINRLTSSRQAVVHDTSGTTRDRKELICEWNGEHFLLIDTGGVDIADPSPIVRQIAEQARAAIGEADLVLFVVDARQGITPGDEELAQILREAKKDVLVLANKVDDPGQTNLAYEFHSLGFGDPLPISGLHGSNTGDLLDEVLDRLPIEAQRTAAGDAIRVAILGRPNVGKSSLFNKLLGEERTIVDSVPGTTRDTIDTTLEHNGRTFVLVDTAGLRRKRRQRQGIDYYTELRALDAAERADVALVLIDSHDGIVEGDVTAVEVARKSHCGTLIVLSKWDISEITIEDVRPELQRRFRQRPSFITISSTTGRGVSRLLDKVAELYDIYVSRVPTGELNRFLGELKEARQPPSKGGRRLNLLYGAQVATRPPRFRFTVNDPGLVTRDYGYWVENQIRERFGLEGVPVAIDFRKRS
jgi:GTP-binding protein